MIYPLATRDISPGPGFSRFNGIRGNGYQDGLHTGGVWFSPDGKECWKPLDGRPFLNSPIHAKTRELEVLQEMAGQPCFPVNWRVETRWQGDLPRRFLVRPKSYIFGTDKCPWNYLKIEQVYQVEHAIRNLNAHWWELGEEITLGIDPDYNLFIVDLSAAGKAGPPFEADDEWRIWRWFKDVLHLDRLEKFRRDAHRVTQGARSIETLLGKNEDWPGVEWQHVYASRNRPVSKIWCNLPETAFLVEGNYQETGVWTWIVNPELLPGELLDRYELVWGWSPIQYKKS